MAVRACAHRVPHASVRVVAAPLTAPKAQAPGLSEVLRRQPRQALVTADTCQLGHQIRDDLPVVALDVTERLRALHSPRHAAQIGLNQRTEAGRGDVPQPTAVLQEDEEALTQDELEVALLELRAGKGHFAWAPCQKGGERGVAHPNDELAQVVAVQCRALPGHGLSGRPGALVDVDDRDGHRRHGLGQRCAHRAKRLTDQLGVKKQRALRQDRNGTGVESSEMAAVDPNLRRTWSQQWPWSRARAGER